MTLILIFNKLTLFLSPGHIYFANIDNERIKFFPEFLYKIYELPGKIRKQSFIYLILFLFASPGEISILMKRKPLKELIEKNPLCTFFCNKIKAYEELSTFSLLFGALFTIDSDKKYFFSTIYKLKNSNFLISSVPEV